MYETGEEITGLSDDYKRINVNNAILELKSSCADDINNDGVISDIDLTLLLGAWGPNQGNPADLNGNGEVDASDLALLLWSWDKC